MHSLVAFRRIQMTVRRVVNERIDGQGNPRIFGIIGDEHDEDEFITEIRL